MENKGLRFLLSLVIALGIWLLVVSVVSPESETTIQNIPVVLNGENTLAERNLIIVSDKNFTVDLKLFGNRVDLNKLTASNLSIIADLSQITEPGEHNVRYDILYPSVVKSGNVEALERNPQYIKLTVVERRWKDVPVRVKYSGSVPADYVADRQNPQFDHATITVSGTWEELEKVDHASISVDLSGKVETITGSFHPVLCAADGTPLSNTEKLSMSVDQIRATIRINKIKRVPLKVAVIAGGGLKEENITMTTSVDSIVVAGSDAILADLNEIVVGEIRLAEMMASAELKFAITMPPGVSNVTGVTELVVQLTLPEMDTYTCTVKHTQFKTINMPANRGVKYVTQEINVTIRGTKEALEALQKHPEWISVLVDCGDVTDETNVTMVLNVTIQIEGEGSAGAVGVYQIIVEVTELSTGG